MKSMFSATGLLGPTPAISSERATEGVLESTFTFVSTGLLDKRPSSTDGGALETEGPPPEGNGLEKCQLSSFTLVDKGLLCNLSTSVSNSISSTSASSLPEPDDSELPLQEEAFDFQPTSSTVLSRVPFSKIRATTYDGETIYLKWKLKSAPLEKTPAQSTSRSSIRNLLDIPIHRLMDQLSAATAASLQRPDNPSTESVGSTHRSHVDEMLWVDKYRPKKFTDLVGNEKVARDALAWIKQWDYCVFGKMRAKKRLRESDENALQDVYRRPHEKVLLLSGPPGLGKTTLAHVLARHAGYEVMEINASDARSGSVVDDRIRPALESGSAIGSTRPILLVIDEIDGATGSSENASTFVHKLVQLVQARPTKKRSKKGHQGPRPILRPVICICNDLNVSALTKLRPLAYSIRFYRPSDNHLVTRLKEICRVERLNADSRALTTLVSVAKGDLRGCLNTLQFIKKRGEEVSEPIIRKATTGMKEGDTNYLSVLDCLFNPLSKKRTKELGMTDEEEGKYVARLSREIDASGRESSIASGCFGHYATLRQHDANLSRHQQGVDWLTTFDMFSAAMYNDGDFALNHYLPYTLVPFYPLFQQRGGNRVERNQVDWEHFQLAKCNEEILNSLSRCLRTATIRYGGDFRHLLSHPILQLEFVPYINRIISPPLRPVNSQIIRPLERALMARLVDIMSSLELRFVQEKADDGQLSYRLDPPIDVFITYDGKRAADITTSRYAVRHLVAGEIEAKLIARDTDFVEKGIKGKHSVLGQLSGSSGNGSNHPSKRVKLDIQDIADKPPTDFFGRPVSIQPSNSTSAPAWKKAEKKFKVSYKFLEGNSAAVRRPIKVNMFL